MAPFAVGGSAKVTKGPRSGGFKGCTIVVTEVPPALPAGVGIAKLVFLSAADAADAPELCQLLVDKEAAPLSAVQASRLNELLVKCVNTIDIATVQDCKTYVTVASLAYLAKGPDPTAAGPAHPLTGTAVSNLPFINAAGTLDSIANGQVSGVEQVGGVDMFRVVDDSDAARSTLATAAFVTQYKAVAAAAPPLPAQPSIKLDGDLGSRTTHSLSAP